MDLNEVADELYGLAPAMFTSRRDARAAQAREEGNRDLATSIKKLRRPTVGAWLANVLARDRREEVSRLLALGAALREATDLLAADDLRRLSQQRHRVVAALVEEARHLALQRDRPPTEATMREVSETLEAALADPEAAAALTAGRLTTTLHYSGFAPGASPSAPHSDRREPPAPPPAEPAGDEQRQAARAALEQAQAALGEAQSALDEATSAAAAVQERLEDLTEQRARQGQVIAELEQQIAELEQRLAELQQRLAELRGEEAQTEEVRNRTGAELEAATERRRTAEQAVSDVRARLDRQSRTQLNNRPAESGL